MKKIYILFFLLLSVLTLGACTPSGDNLVDTELADYKIEAIEIIENYKNPSLYREIQKLELEVAKSIGIIDITNATDKSKVDNAVSNVKSSMDKIKTNAELILEELEENALKLLNFKNEAIEQLHNYKSAGDYNENGQSLLVSIITEGQVNIALAGTLEEVSIALANAKIKIDEIKTASEVLKDELEAYKAEAINTIKNYKDEKDYYYLGQLELKVAVNNAINSINEAIDKVSVDSIINSTKALINEILTEEPDNNDELENYQQMAKEFLENYKDESIYNAEGKAELIAEIEKCTENILSALTKEEINIALNNAITEINKIKTASEVLKDELEAYKAEAINTIKNYKDEKGYYYLGQLELKVAVNNAINSINEAIDKVSVDSIISSTKAIIDEILTEESDNNELKNYQQMAEELLSGYKDKSLYYSAEQLILEEFINDGIISINNALTKEEVNQALVIAISKIEKIMTILDYENQPDDLAELKEYTIIYLNDYVDFTSYRTAEIAIINDLIASAILDINNALDAQEVNSILSTVLEDINDVKTNAEYELEEAQNALENLNNAKNQAIIDLESYCVRSNYYQEELDDIDGIIATFKPLILESLTIDSVSTLLASALLQLDEVKTKEQIDIENGSQTDPDIKPVGDFEVIEVKGDFESMYMTFKNIINVDGYNAYYRESLMSGWKSVDSMLIRGYADYSRVDVLGLKTGTYELKVVAVKDNVELSDLGAQISDIFVMPHVRDGYAFVNGTSSGAYNEDGTLKANARVIYITEGNKDTVSLDVTGASNPCVGLQAIFDGYKKKQDTRPLAVRLIGNISDFAVMQSGDIVLENGNYNVGITLEGVGNDAVANGWGLRIKNSSNVEVRNIGFMLVDSTEGDNLGLQQGNDHIWVHNNDFFYGMAGGDSDQAKGDGALDTKKSKYITHSYNHFWDTGKTHLVGNGESVTEQNFITFHHNWYDHSDSRHPRVRQATVHVYNNLFDGISKYGIGVTTGASVYVEGNVFNNTKNPLMSSKQGTDALGEGTFSKEDGGMIKAYNNLMLGSTNLPIYSKDNNSFDAYLALTRDEKVPDTVKTVAGNNTYNNFDTDSSMYKYSLTNVNDVLEHVKKYAGRVGGGDFTFEFTAADITSYSVNQELKNKLINYKPTVITAGGIKISDTTNPVEPTEPTDPTEPTTPGAIDGVYIVNFTESYTNWSIFTFSGSTDGKSYSITYDGITLTKAVKMETATSITFTTESKSTLILVLSTETGKIKINNASYTAVNYVVTVNLNNETTETHKITKEDSLALLYIKLTV